MNRRKDKANPAADEQRKPEANTAPIVGPKPRAAPEQPPPITDADKCRGNKKWTNDAPMFWVTLAGVIVVIAYTSVAAYQAYLSRLQLREMEGGRRPWISVKVDISGPLTFNSEGAHLPMKFTFLNSGQTPALFVFPRIAHKFDQYNIKALLERQMYECQIDKERFNNSLISGFTINPNKEQSWELLFNVERKEVVSRIFSPGTPIFDIAILGCVSYKFAYAEVIGQTGFIYSLRRTDANGETRSAIFPNQGDIPANQLVLANDLITAKGFFSR